MMYATQLLSFQQDIITQLLSKTYTCLGWQEEEWILIGRLLHPNLIDASASFKQVANCFAADGVGVLG